MEEMYLNIGAHIRFRDGMGGTLHRVVIDPNTKRITDLVIVQGFLQRHDYVIPVSSVEKATPEEIQVALHIQDLANYPEYREVEFEEHLNDWESELLYPREHVLVWYPLVGIREQQRAVLPVIHRRISKGIPTGEEVIGRSSVVRNIDGVVGKIDHLWLNRENWEITHLIVRRGLIPHYAVIPFSWISSITPEEVFIQGSNEQLMEVPIMQLHVEPTRISGVEEVNEGYHLDESLTIAEEVIAALAEDPRTASSVIEVIYECGVLTLMGPVENEEAHRAAEEIAHRHERVVSVVNALEVRSKPDVIDTVASTLGVTGATGLWRRS
jgi:uncharacterized protein YrrD/predicted DNA-binding antitoxin AbrB/MazE fold protein